MAMVQEYHQEYGDLDVPTDYITKSGCQLGYWIKEQRKKYKGGDLAEKQIRDLERFGMTWGFYERKVWEDWFRLAEMYYQKYGNLLVPASYQTAGETGWEAGSLYSVSGIGRKWPQASVPGASKSSGRDFHGLGSAVYGMKIGMPWFGG